MTTLRTLTLLATVALAPAVQAKTLVQQFTNDYDANAIYLFAADPAALDFERITFPGVRSGWTVTMNTGDEVTMRGPRTAPGELRFNATMNYVTKPFSIEWAEVFFGTVGNRVLGTGTLTWNGGWTATNGFTHFAALAADGVVPLPPSVVMLLSACGLLPLMRRRPTR